MADDHEEQSALSYVLRGLMAEQGIDAATLAERSKLGLSTIHSYLSGRSRGDRPRPGTLEALATALHVDVSELYAVGDRPDARGERRLVAYYRMLGTETDRAEAIEAVRRIAWRARPNG